MTDKPTVSTRWASDAGADKTEPGVGVQQWGMPERGGVAHDLLNGQFDNIDQWIGYFRANAAMFSSVSDFVLSEDVGVGDAGLVVPDLGLGPFNGPWAKTAAQLGGHAAIACCTDGRRVFVMTASGGDLYVLDARDGDDLTPAVAPLANPGYGTAILRTDGHYLYCVFASYAHLLIVDPAVSTYAAALVADITNKDSSAIVDFCVDGQRAYLIDASKDVRAYEDLFTSPNIDWEDESSFASSSGLLHIATNGRKLAVSHGQISGVNLSLYSVFGTSPLNREMDPDNDPDGGALVFTRDHLLAGASTGGLYALPGYGDVSQMGGTYPALITRGGVTDGTNVLEVAPVKLVACGGYLAQAYNTSTHGYVALFRWSGVGGTLLPMWAESYQQSPQATGTIVDIALGPDHLVVVTKPLAGTGVVVTCYRLPVRKLRVIRADSTHRFRAPFYGAVIVEEEG